MVFKKAPLNAYIFALFLACGAFFYCFASAAIAQDMAHANAPKDPNRFYHFVHGLSPEAAVKLWRGDNRPSLKKLLKKRGFTLGAPVYLRLFKMEGLVEVWMQRGRQYDLFEVYPICINSGQLGPKLREGDQQAPEGFYEVSAQSLNPNSRYHLAINMGYPNIYDRAHGRTGAHLMIHGACASIGCYALTDDNIEEVYALVRAALEHGQARVSVHAFPFRMNNVNLARYRKNKWYRFWSREMLPAAQEFEATRKPPRMAVCSGVYRVIGHEGEQTALPKGCMPVAQQD